MKRTRLSICEKKRRYADEEEALAAVQRASVTLRSYRCDRCGLFHLTSRTKGKRVTADAFAGCGDGDDIISRIAFSPVTI